MMITITDLVDKTGLNPAYITKCMLRMKDVFRGHIHKDKTQNNRNMFDPKAVEMFMMIKKEKDKGLTIPEIRNRLFSDIAEIIEIVEEPDTQGKNGTGKTNSQPPRMIVFDKENAPDPQNPMEMWRAYMQTRQRELETKAKLDTLTHSMQMLPFELNEIWPLFYEVAMTAYRLEEKTKPKWGQGAHVKDLRSKLTALLKLKNRSVFEFNEKTLEK